VKKSTHRSTVFWLQIRRENQEQFTREQTD
jgi:hypothetical protein